MNRMTNQRRVILDELKKHYDHPTADDIYTEVKKQLPKVSLGTVYRNLEQMSDLGLILKIEGKGPKRFDPTPTAHPHFRCVECGCVEDVPEAKSSTPLNIESSWLLDREIKGIILEYYGLCPKCTRK